MNAPGIRDQSQNGQKQGRLPGAIGADDGRGLSGRDGAMDFLQDIDLTETNPQIFNFNSGSGEPGYDPEAY